MNSSARSKARYPALNPRFNLKIRNDYTEHEYVDGVYDDNNDMLLRPLNKEEKKFLNDFYEESVNANFMHDKKLRSLYMEMKSLKNKRSLTNEELSHLDYLQLQYLERESEVLLYSEEKDRKRIYGENNSRNRCLYNRSKASGKLFQLNHSTFNENPDRPKFVEDCIVKRKKNS